MEVAPNSAADPQEVINSNDYDLKIPQISSIAPLSGR
jgi:hypothetical protein